MGPIETGLLVVWLLALGAIPMDALIGVHTPWPWRILVWVGWPIGFPIIGIVMIWDWMNAD